MLAILEKKMLTEKNENVEESLAVTANRHGR